MTANAPDNGAAPVEILHLQYGDSNEGGRMRGAEGASDVGGAVGSACACSGAFDPGASSPKMSFWLSESMASTEGVALPGPLWPMLSAGALAGLEAGGKLRHSRSDLLGFSNRSIADKTCDMLLAVSFSLRATVEILVSITSIRERKA